MQTDHTILSTQATIRQWQRQGHRVGFVPTMGNLHAGHLALVEEARRRCDKVAVSVFVNPLQFGPNEDFDSYPRTLKQDSQALAELEVDLLFAPSVNEMYPHGREQRVHIAVPHLGDILEGASRPGFFEGVATVVNKLFNIIPADVAVFGEKDFQQLLVVRQMVADFNMPIEVVGLPIVREADGLAMSSRNQYLTAEQRAIAPRLNHGLQQAAQKLQSGRHDFTVIEHQTRDELNRQGFRTDYVAIRRPRDLQAAQGSGSEWVILAAAWLGETRLIDNIFVKIQ